MSCIERKVHTSATQKDNYITITFVIRTLRLRSVQGLWGGWNMHGHHLRDLRLDGKRHENGSYRIKGSAKVLSGYDWIRIKLNRGFF